MCHLLGNGQYVLLLLLADMEKQKIDIPEELIEICRDMANVARKHGLIKFSGSFTPRTNWGGDISFGWEAGRHGEDGDEIKISSQFTVFTKVSGTQQNI